MEEARIEAHPDTVKAILAAFDRAEKALQTESLSGIMAIYSKAYRHRGLRKEDTSRMSKVYKPSGLRSDGPASVYEKFRMEPGPHEVRLDVQEMNGPSETVRSERIDFRAGRVVLLP